jgi:cysteine desulfurase
MKTAYLDYAAATPLDEDVLTAMRPYFAARFYNPSAQYLAAQAIAKDIESARSRVAKHLGVRAPEIIFTAGGTEANNLAIRGVMEQFPGKKVIVSAIEHESVLEPARQYLYAEAPVKADGIMDEPKLESLIDDETVLVSVMYANNEIGTIQPLREIGQVIQAKIASRRSKGIDLPLYFHTDACQAANYLSLLVNKLGVDMMTINAGKIYGPKQTGALFVSTGTRLRPQILGGGQERGARSGTEGVANVIGFAAALDKAAAMRDAESRRLKILQNLFFQLTEEKLHKAEVSGSRKHRLPNNVHLMLPGKDNERLMMALDEAGIQCATGSACSASNDEPSHVLKAIGYSDEAAQASLRFTMGRGTTDADIRRTVEVLSTL